MSWSKAALPASRQSELKVECLKVECLPASLSDRRMAGFRITVHDPLSTDLCSLTTDFAPNDQVITQALVAHIHNVGQI
jgi:hypothetical protein